MNPCSSAALHANSLKQTGGILCSVCVSVCSVCVVCLSVCFMFNPNTANRITVSFVFIGFRKTFEVLLFHESVGIGQMCVISKLFFCSCACSMSVSKQVCR